MYAQELPDKYEATYVATLTHYTIATDIYVHIRIS